MPKTIEGIITCTEAYIASPLCQWEQSKNKTKQNKAKKKLFFPTAPHFFLILSRIFQILNSFPDFFLRFSPLFPILSFLSYPEVFLFSLSILGVFFSSLLQGAGRYSAPPLLPGNAIELSWTLQQYVWWSKWQSLL